MFRDVSQGKGYCSGSIVRGFFKVLGRRVCCKAACCDFRRLGSTVRECVGCCGRGEVGRGLK